MTSKRLASSEATKKTKTIPIIINNTHLNQLQHLRETTTRDFKRRACYSLLGGILFIQTCIVPWLLSSKATSIHNNVVGPPGSLFSLSSTSSTDAAGYPHRGLGNPSSPLLPPPPASADGTLNQYPIYWKQQQQQHDNPSSSSFHSTVHCIGETHNPETSWMYRSCEFTNLCLDVATREFYLIESPLERKLQTRKLPQMYFSTEFSSLSNTTTTSHDTNKSPINKNNKNNKTTTLTVALGGINPRWMGKDFNQGVEKVQWFPKRLTQPPDSYYLLDDSVIMIPFHSFAGHNVGHLLWDDFLPIFTLLQLFGWIDPMANDASPKMLLLRVDTLPLLYGTCEMRRKKRKKCQANFEKFLPMLGISPETFTTLQTVQFQPNQHHPGVTNTNTNTNTTMVCAKHALAGIGMLTDHGLKDHGWLMPKESYSVHNLAKGPLLYQFRNFILQNLGLPIAPPTKNNENNISPVFRILLSEHSSSDPGRDFDFANHERILKNQAALSTTLSNVPVTVQRVTLSNMGMKEQVELVSQSQVYISTCGGGAMTATFLPKGASLILYYDEKGGIDFVENQLHFTQEAALLDWDLFNNMAYLRVHWLPIGTTFHTLEGWQILVDLILHEMDVWQSGI